MSFWVILASNVSLMLVLVAHMLSMGYVSPVDLGTAGLELKISTYIYNRLYLLFIHLYFFHSLFLPFSFFLQL